MTELRNFKHNLQENNFTWPILHSLLTLSSNNLVYFVTAKTDFIWEDKDLDKITKGHHKTATVKTEQWKTANLKVL